MASILTRPRRQWHRGGNCDVACLAADTRNAMAAGCQIAATAGNNSQLIKFAYAIFGENKPKLLSTKELQACLSPFVSDLRGLIAGCLSEGFVNWLSGSSCGAFALSQ